MWAKWRRLEREGWRWAGRRYSKWGDPGETEFEVLKGHPKAKEDAVAARLRRRQMIGDDKGKKMKEFQIYRWNPNSDRKPFLQSFFVDLSDSGTMVLDVLQKIKGEQDSSLSYRRSCREGICGSCAMNIDGLNNLACLKPINTNLSQPCTITPLPHFFVIKDLVVDLSNFYQQYKSIEPWLKRKKDAEENEREYRQSPKERKKLDGLYECILCACCSGACPEYWWNPESFLGPASLIQAYRWISDSRDEYAAERLQAMTEDRDKLHGCRRVGNCTANCPKSLDPERAIEIMKQEHLYPSIIRPLHTQLAV
ncbi:succinate dehydrogenase [ubiquinone] iron-sulfur subunit 3, mitochondrial-like [Wolffia australiana]